MFQPVPSNVRFPELEEEILAFWSQRRIYEKSLQRRRRARGSCSTKARRRPTACRIPATA